MRRINRSDYPDMKIITTSHGWYTNRVGLIVFASNETNDTGSYYVEFYDPELNGKINGGCVFKENCVSVRDNRLIEILYGLE